MLSDGVTVCRREFFGGGAGGRGGSLVRLPRRPAHGRHLPPAHSSHTSRLGPGRTARSAAGSAAAVGGMEGGGAGSPALDRRRAPAGPAPEPALPQGPRAAAGYEAEGLADAETGAPTGLVDIGRPSTRRLHPYGLLEAPPSPASRRRTPPPPPSLSPRPPAATQRDIRIPQADRPKPAARTPALIRRHRCSGAAALLASAAAAQ